jgi:hypothetical protein
VPLTCSALGTVLHDLRGPDLLVADGYADLDPAARPGLGGHAHAESGIPVIEVAKPRFRTATHGVPVVRGSSGRRRSSPRPGAPRRRSRPGPAHGRPVPAARRTAPPQYPRTGRPARSQHDRPTDLPRRAERGMTGPSSPGRMRLRVTMRTWMR